MSILNITQVKKNFVNEDKQIVALDEVNLQIDSGEFLCILGPSGCGKSTLLRCIAGFEQVTEGEILLEEKQVQRPGPDRTMVFQGFDQLFPWKTVFDNVAYPLKVNNLGTKKEIESRAAKFISLVGLSDFQRAYPHQLSGGMKHRVAIARALALEPKVLLMDEPFASLDAQTRTALQKELIKLWEEIGTTIIFITHNIEEAIILGTKVAVMSKRPGTIKKVLEIKLERPRTAGNPNFGVLWQALNNLLDM